MKLVNVEDLKVLVAVESKGEIRYGKLVTDLFDDIPTVEAIPIEYIEDFKKKVRHIAPVKEVIDWLLENWEKEHGE